MRIKQKSNFSTGKERYKQLTKLKLWQVQLRWLERQIVALEVTGSNPVTYPNTCICTEAAERKGLQIPYREIYHRRFESCQMLQKNMHLKSLINAQKIQIYSIRIWWNGRHAALRTQCSKGRAGSTPVIRTMRTQFNGKTSVFQTDIAGSIPAVRSKLIS